MCVAGNAPRRPRERFGVFGEAGDGKRGEPHDRQRDATSPRTCLRCKPSRWCETTRAERDDPLGRGSPKGASAPGSERSRERRWRGGRNPMGGGRVLRHEGQPLASTLKELEAHGGVSIGSPPKRSTGRARKDLEGAVGDDRTPGRERERPTTRYCARLEESRRVFIGTNERRLCASKGTGTPRGCRRESVGTRLGARDFEGT